MIVPPTIRKASIEMLKMLKTLSPISAEATRIMRMLSVTLTAAHFRPPLRHGPSSRAACRRCLLGRVANASAGNRGHHQRQAGHEEIDADEQAERPDHAPRPTCDDDAGEDQISNAANFRPCPRSREQLAVLDRRHYLRATVRREEDGQSHSQRDEPSKRPPHQKGANEDRQHGPD